MYKNTYSRVFTLFFFLFSAVWANAQNIINDLVWAKKFAANGLYHLLVETDQQNNILLAGGFLSCPDCYIAWEGDSLYYQGNYTNDIFLAKLDSNGILLWTQLIAGEGDEYLSGFRVDNHGNIVLWVSTDQPFDYSGQPMDVGHNLIKLDENGQFLWAQNVQGATDIGQLNLFAGLAKHLSITCNDDIVLSASVRKLLDYNVIIDTMAWGSDTVFVYQDYFDTLRVAGQHFAVDTNNIFVAKFSAQGDLNWVKTFEHSGYLNLTSLDASVNEEINILGYYGLEDWHINGQTLPIDTIGYLYKENIYLMKLDPEGEIVWINRYFDNALPYNLITDPSGNIVCLGNFYQKTYFGQDTLYHTGQSAFLFKVDSSGQYLWATNEKKPVAPGSHFILANHLNDIYFSGDINPHLGPILMKYAADGHWLWTLNPTQSSNRDGGDIAFDYSGNLIQTGLYSGAFKIGTFTLPYDQSGDWHQFLLKFKAQTQPGPHTFCDVINGTAEPVTGRRMQLSPNPSTGKLLISLPEQENGPFQVELLDMSGRRLMQQALVPETEGKYPLDLNGFPSGAYFLRVLAERFSETRMLILQGGMKP